MKLRNKKTGEIKELPDGFFCGDNLKKICEEWEDYEEPKKYWFIGDNGAVFKFNRFLDNTELEKEYKEIDNYFETKEEAEQAVEKLKAWKRLKDKGFRFDVVPALGHCDDEKFDISIIATMPAKWWYNDKVVDDIHYVFGGEE